MRWYFVLGSRKVCNLYIKTAVLTLTYCWQVVNVAAAATTVSSFLFHIPSFGWTFSSSSLTGKTILLFNRLPNFFLLKINFSSVRSTTTRYKKVLAISSLRVKAEIVRRMLEQNNTNERTKDVFLCCRKNNKFQVEIGRRK